MTEMPADSPDARSGTASTAPPVAIDTGTEKPKWERQDTEWTLSLFGTAVGAGILFLPITAGSGGLWTLIVMTALIGPLTYLSHRALARFVLHSSRPGSDITEVVEEYFGAAAGRIVTILYFFAIYPIVLIYGVGITNTVSSLFVNQFGWPELPRWLLSGVLIALLMLVMIAGERIMLIAVQWVVYPLVICLIGVSLYLIPSWRLEGLTDVQAPGAMLMTIWLTIPVLIFAFNHSPAISQFSLAMQRRYGAEAAVKARQILKANAAILLLFTMGFVFSCVLALGLQELLRAREANLPVLSHLANVHDSPIVAYFAPVIAIAAIVSSFFGHYLGAAEGLAGIVRGFADPDGTRISVRKMNTGVAVFIFLTTWLAAILNPSILGLIETIAGPVIASILYLMPMYAIHKVPALAPYRGKLSNVFVTVAGVLAVAAILAGFLGLG